MNVLFPDWFILIHDLAPRQNRMALFTYCLSFFDENLKPTVSYGNLDHAALCTVYFQPSTFSLLYSLSLYPYLSSLSAAASSYVKSLETASMKLGADMRMVNVQIMEKREKATRHSRSTTAAANFHSLQMASASSWSRNRWAI